MKDDACVAFSIIEDDWCIGCSAELDESHTDGAPVGYTKAGKMLQTKFCLVTRSDIICTLS